MGGVVRAVKSIFGGGDSDGGGSSTVQYVQPKTEPVATGATAAPAEVTENKEVTEQNRGKRRKGKKSLMVNPNNMPSVDGSSTGLNL